MSGFIASLVTPGPAGPLRALARYAARRALRIGSASHSEYRPPDADELASIEAALADLETPLVDLVIDPAEFAAFGHSVAFPTDYHGGHEGGVFDEKLLEHFVAWKLLGLDRAAAAPYVDIAACASPWAKLLREQGIESYAIDLAVAPELASLPYYRSEDATHSSFADRSVRSASLQCAFEMFAGTNDTELVHELGRILAPGGRAVIAPLYMHTHACHYQTPEYVGRVHGDPGAKTYVRRDCWGVPTSRKYSVETLKQRVIDPAVVKGLRPHVQVLRNASAFGEGVYLHFILVLDQPEASP